MRLTRQTLSRASPDGVRRLARFLGLKCPAPDTWRVRRHIVEMVVRRLDADALTDAARSGDMYAC